MNKNISQQQQRANSGNRFSRHPAAAFTLVFSLALLFILIISEIFLKTFSGLGNPPLYELSPLYGYRLKGKQVIEPRGGMGFLYGARLSTNNLGIRAAAEWDANPAGKILFIGDSVTYGGQYVADGQLFSSIAGGWLAGWQAGNSGNNAWGVENIVGLLLDHDFSPAEVVVTCLLEGDFYRGLTRASSLPLWTEQPRFALQNLMMHIIWRTNESRYGTSIDAVIRDEVHLDQITNRAARRLKELDDHLQDRQVKHFIFVLPTRSQIVDNEPPDPRVKEAIRRYGIDARYLLPELMTLERDATKRRKWFHDEVHLEAAGHFAYGTLIGSALAKALSD